MHSTMHYLYHIVLIAVTLYSVLCVWYVECTDGLGNKKVGAVATGECAANGDGCASDDDLFSIDDNENDPYMVNKSFQTDILLHYLFNPPQLKDEVSGCENTQYTVYPSYSKSNQQNDNDDNLINVVDAYKQYASGQHKGMVFIMLNGENDGIFVGPYQPKCHRSLALFTLKHLLPQQIYDTEHSLPLYMFNQKGLPILNSQNVLDITNKRFPAIHILLSRETWIWPGIKIGYRWKLGNGAELETLSLRPRVILVHNFISNEQIDRMIKIGSPRLERSPEKHYSEEFKDYRTSRSGFLSIQEDKVIKDVHMRAEEIARLPNEMYVESPQLLAYQPGEHYKKHHDFFHEIQKNIFLQLNYYFTERLGLIAAYRYDPNASADDIKILNSLKEQILKAKNSNNKKKYPLYTRCFSKFPSEFMNNPGILSSALEKTFGYGLLSNKKSWNLLLQNKQELERVIEYTISLLSQELSLPEKDFRDIMLLNLNGRTIIEERQSSLSQKEIENLQAIIPPFVFDVYKFVEPNRHCTLLPYLSDVEEGGETVFPKSSLNNTIGDASDSTRPLWCRDGLKVKPKKGSGALFYHRYGNGDLDYSAEHIGCPPRKGVKYALNVFMWNVPFEVGYHATGG